MPSHIHNKPQLSFAANLLNRKGVYASLLVLTPVIASVSVHAADEAVNVLEEVTVSADFRETTLDDSTVSVTVTSEEEIEKRGAQHIENMLSTSTNVNAASGSSRARYFQIRGIGERSQFIAPINPSVGLYVDGIDLSRSGGSATLFDVDQVEVIRGPQGTKFGANALAGIINISANEPTNEWQGKIAVDLGNFNKQSIGIAAGGPLVKDKLLGRFSLHSNKSDGYIENDFLQRDDTNNIDEMTARGHLKWFANDDLSVDLRYLHLNIDNGYDAFNFDNDRTTNSDEPGVDKQKTDAFSINSSWDMNDKVTLETSVSHSSSSLEYSYDDDWSYVGEFDDSLFPYSGFDQYLRERENTALEARLLSGDEGRLFNGKTDWVAGIYHSDKSEDLTRNYTFLDETFFNNYDTQNTALYGQLDTQVSDKTKLITGLRVEKWSADYNDSNNNDIPVDETLYGGKLGVEYEVNESHLTHATISRGYKAGGVNPSSDLRPEQLAFDTEFLWNFEVGVNSSLLNDKINTRVSVFYAERKDQQTKNSIPLPDGANGTRFLDLTSNAASGSNYGLEAELDWAVNNKLTLITSIGLLQAEFDVYETPDQNFSGRDQAHAPNYQYSIGAEYKLNSSITAGLSLEGKDGFFFSDSHDERADSYQVLNANLSYERKNVTTTFWGRNLLDEDYDTRGFFFGNNPGNGYEAEEYTQKGEPRVFGVNLTVDF